VAVVVVVVVGGWCLAVGGLLWWSVLMVMAIVVVGLRGQRKLPSVSTKHMMTSCALRTCDYEIWRNIK
jgi:hypothetical protein